MTEQDPHPPDDGVGSVGSVGEEAVKLLGVLGDWARDHGPDLSDLADHATAAAAQVNEHVATGSPECTYCPICRTVHVVRQASPEVRTHLAQATMSFLQAATLVVAQLAPGDASGGSASDPTARQRRVEHIDLDDGFGADEGTPEGDQP